MNQQQAPTSPGISPASPSHSPESSVDAADMRVGQREKRTNPRYGTDCAVLVSVHAGAVPLPGQLVDISLTGCRVLLPTGQLSGIMTRVELQFELRGIGFRIDGVTVGSRTKRGLAIRFLEMSDRRRESLVEVLTELAREEEAKVKEDAKIQRGAIEAAKGKAQPTQVSPGQPVQARAESVCGPTAGVGKSVEVKLDKQGDRRISSRHDVDTRARLVLIRSNIPMDGTIQNLSQTGCRIRTDERFNVGIFVRLEIEFYLHGLPFRLAGVTQAIVDKFSVGIRFLDMSQRSREQLIMLIEEIERAEAELDNAVS